MRLSHVTFALVLAVSAAGAQHHTRSRRGGAERIVQPPPVTFDAGDINNPNQPEISRGDKGSAVLRAQILLDRAHFSCGQLDGNFGTNLNHTVSAYQAEQHIPVTGAVDAATWQALNRDTAPPLIQYTISPDDEKGPWVNVPHNMLEQAKLPYLGYASPLDELSEHFHTSPAVMQALNPGADFSQAGQTLTVPNVMTMPPGEAHNVVVSKSESSVRVYDDTGKLIAFYMCTTGSRHDPLPIGDWKITAVHFNPYFHYNAKLFWDAKDKDEKALIKPGPRNPVGLVWMDLSKPHYGIHGTPDPQNIGHTRSHGCIRVTNWDAVELADMVKPDTPALLRE